MENQGQANKMKNDLQVKSDCLVWQDLTVDMPTRNHIRRRLLDNLTGYAQPGRTMVILGPSGCGKTTFLDSLAGRLSPHLQQSGQVSLKGRSIDRNAVVSPSLTSAISNCIEDQLGAECFTDCLASQIEAPLAYKRM